MASQNSSNPSSSSDPVLRRLPPISFLSGLQPPQEGSNSQSPPQYNLPPSVTKSRLGHLLNDEGASPNFRPNISRLLNEEGPPQARMIIHQHHPRHTEQQESPKGTPKRHDDSTLHETPQHQDSTVHQDTPTHQPIATNLPQNIITPVKAEFTPSELIVKNDSALEFAKKFTRTHLGVLEYDLSKEKDLHKVLGPRKSEFEPVFELPELRSLINCILTVRIAQKFLVAKNNPNLSVLKRRLWGTDIYTDDSDVVAVLKHCGFVKDRGDETYLQLNEDLKSLLGEEEIKEYTPGNTELSVERKENGSGDVEVDLLILPTLRKYCGSFRNGINSRSWNGHDGVSIAVHSVRFL